MIADAASASVESAASSTDEASQPNVSPVQFVTSSAAQLLTSEPTELAAGVFGMRVLMVNVYFVAIPGGFVLIDAGLPHTQGQIVAAAEKLFGADARPEAILLTHAHFDHVGSLQALLERWPGVPVYAHSLELPFLTGRSSYAPPDPWVGGGMSLSSVLYPRGPIDISNAVVELPDDGSIPGMEGWRWIYTPGHSPGHVSFFRDDDRTLVVGDAFVTTKQESMLSVMSQAAGVFGPPAYFTHDWTQAAESVRTLARLDPAVAGTGHGRALAGDELTTKLDALAGHFNEVAVPAGGRYAGQPAVYDETGLIFTPPARYPPLRYVAGALIAGAVVALAISTLAGDRDDRRRQRAWW